MGGGGLGIGTIIVLGLVGYAFGIDPRILIGGAEILTGGGQAPTYQTDRRSAPAKTGAPKDEMGSMISGILGEIDDRWSEIFQASGRLTPGRRSCCSATPPMAGAAAWRSRRWGRSTARRTSRSSSTPASSARSRRASAAAPAMPASSPPPTSSRMRPAITSRTCSASFRACTRLQQQAGSKAEANALQVKVELQADCLSGVWVNREEKKRPDFLEAGDIDAALTTATAIGDDTLQRQATGRVVPDLHPRLGRAAQAVVHDRLPAGHGAGLQHVRRGSRID